MCLKKPLEWVRLFCLLSYYKIFFFLFIFGVQKPQRFFFKAVLLLFHTWLESRRKILSLMWVGWQVMVLDSKAATFYRSTIPPANIQHSHLQKLFMIPFFTKREEHTLRCYSYLKSVFKSNHLQEVLISYSNNLTVRTEAWRTLVTHRLSNSSPPLFVDSPQQCNPLSPPPICPFNNPVQPVYVWMWKLRM